MVMFHPATRPSAGTRTLTAHEEINQAVAFLNVVCTGQENERLYFEKLPGATDNNQALVQEIAHALMNTPAEVREGLRAINTISLKA